MVDDAELHPDNAGARVERQRLVDDAADRIAGAEDVDHVDRLADLGEARDDGRAMDAAPGYARIDADAVVAARHEKREDAVRRPRRIGGEADDGDAFDGAEDVERGHTRSL